MIDLKTLKKMFLVTVTASALAACGGDSNTELASPGSTGPNPGTGGGGGTGGSGGGTTVECPSSTTEVTLGSGTACQISGEILDDLTLTADNTYLLSGKVSVGRQANADGTGGAKTILTIAAGTVIAGEDANAYLVVTRGSQIEAEGTSSNPIVFTSAADVQRGSTNTTDALAEAYTSEWGGLVINGLATINRGTDAGNGILENDGEADSGKYGGNDDDDSSGTLKYVQVKYAGNPITADDELNGIAFQGVGRGTTLEYIHVHNGADDGIEFFGGTADAKYLIITGADDDSLDWTNGYRGRIQYLLIMQNDNQAASDQGIEADSNSADNDATPRARPVISNATIIGGQVEGDIGILLREGTGAEIYNTVVSGFLDKCLDIDGASTYAARDGATGIVMESVRLSCDKLYGTDTDDTDLQSWFEGQANNSTGASTLSGFFNGVEENAQTTTDVSAADAWFDAVDYIGAVKSTDSSDNWTLGWSYAINPTPTCPNGTTSNNSGGCILEGTYTGNLRLVQGLDYFLRGKVVIGEDLGPDAANPISTATAGVLTVDAGVTVFGEDPQSYLVVSRGSQLNSNGTAGSPVTFTATNDSSRDLNNDTALWGGLVINGRSTINRGVANGGILENDGEADSGKYGGNDDADDSGQMFYTVVKYAGNPITADDELNGIAFQGVGAGTEVDYLQVHNGADDGIEFFGGTVEVKHIVVTGADDDSIDWTNGWRGKIQYAVVVQNDNQAASDQGIEADSNSADNDASPRARPMISNITLVGGDVEGDIGILLREGTGAVIYNAVVANFQATCLDIDGASTYTARDGADGIDMQSTMLSCTKLFATDADDTDLQAWFETAGKNNVTGTSTLAAPTGGSKAYINGSAESGATVTDPTALNAFFAPTTFIGAVESASANWLAGWTVWVND